MNNISSNMLWRAFRTASDWLRIYANEIFLSLMDSCQSKMVQLESRMGEEGILLVKRMMGGQWMRMDK